MKRPTLEEVREYFKDAKVVKCASGAYGKYDGLFHITKYTDIVETYSEFLFGEDEFDETDNDQFVVLWGSDNGYAKILEYKSKQPTMKKVIRLDQPKEEKQPKPIELTHYLNDRGWEGVTNDLEMKSIKEVKLMPDTQVICEDVSLFLVKFNDDNYIIYKGHLNDGVY